MNPKNTIFSRKCVILFDLALFLQNKSTCVQLKFKHKNISIMKRTLIIALGCLAMLFAACKKPVEPTPTPTPVDYTAKYVGNYMGQFTLTIKSMNNQPQSSLSFPVDGIKMDITKGTANDAIIATVTVDNESHQTNGTATADKADFETVHLLIDKPDQNYTFNLDLKMEGTKVSDTLNIVGTFSGDGNFTMPTGEPMQLDEVSGDLIGKIVKQQ